MVKKLSRYDAIDPTTKPSNPKQKKFSGGDFEKPSRPRHERVREEKSKFVRKQVRRDAERVVKKTPSVTTQIRALKRLIERLETKPVMPVDPVKLAALKDRLRELELRAHKSDDAATL